LPASYHTPPIAVTAIFSALMTKVGVYALFRMFTLVFTHDVAFTHTVILGIAILSMVVGVLGAAAQQDVRRILSFHIVSQIGYIVLGLALFTPLALAGAVFYLVHNIIAKTNLFLVGGVMNRLAGSFDLAAIGGLYRYAPVLAALFLLSALSLAGLPPLSGFWAKLLLVQASLEIEAWIVAGVALTVGLLTLYSMTKIWTLGFWKPEPVARIAPPRISGFERLALYAPIVAMSGLTVIMGLWAEPFLAAADRAAEELLDPRLYLDAVLGGSS
jgi:multicomponent Na+:H+ antiporter subunit D